MPSLSSHDKQLSFSAFGCKGQDFAPHVHKDEVLMVQESCAGRNRKDIVTCSDEGVVTEDIRDINGLDMLSVNLSGGLPRLPSFIPVIPRDMFNHPAETVPAQLVGVSLNDILTQRASFSDGHYRFPENSHIKEDVLKSNVFQGKDVILFSSNRDIVIETLWWRYRIGEIDLPSIIARMGFIGVTGMNFSVFTGECPVAHAINLKKSLVYSGALDQLGVWSIPHIYAINAHQRGRWKEWHLANTAVRIVTINAQLQKKERDFYEVTNTVQFLMEKTDVIIILQGYLSKLPCDIRRKYADRISHATSSHLKRGIATGAVASSLFGKDLDKIFPMLQKEPVTSGSVRVSRK